MTREEIDECSKNPEKSLVLNQKTENVEVKERKKPKYTPLSKRQDRPDAILWLVKNYPEITDGQISKLVGSTKGTVSLIRKRSYWNFSNLKARDPVILALCTQDVFEKALAKATRRVEREKKAKLKIIKKEFKAYEKELVTLNTANKELGELGNKPETFYTDKRDAFEHRASLEKLEEQLRDKEKEEDPYNDQINEMTEQALAEIEYTLMNELVKVREHQDFLLKLLTNKDSFVRKRIIEQNLSYLNARLSQYLDRIGLPHEVTFLNDLTVEIQELGRELDFDNLSRGERNRLILSLSWAFRDVWESLYDPINLLFIDELVDSGMDGSGVEAAMAILKKMSREHNKSIWLVSHKDELSGRVNNVMTVTKENGFTSYNTDVDII